MILYTRISLVEYSQKSMEDRVNHESLMKINEKEMNVLSIKIIIGIIIIGFGLIALLIYMGVISITWLEWLYMVIFSISIVGLETVLWYFFKDKPFLKYTIVFFNSIIFFFLFYVNEINLAMSPFWLLPLALSILYFHLPLSLFASILTFAGNTYTVFTDPGRGMEMVDISAKATNSIIILITSFSLLFLSIRGRELLQQIGHFEHQSREKKDLLEEIVIGSQSLAKDTSSLSNSLSQTATGLHSSFEEITESTLKASCEAEELKEKSSRLSSFSQDITNDITMSQKALKEMEEEMDDCEASIKGFDRYFTTLRENVERVEKILLSMERIAGETHMLALNASIEAARAGEHGHQFSVVAEEVENLAGESSQASREMNTIVLTMKEQVEETLEVLTEGTQKMQDGIKGIHKTREIVGASLHLFDESHQEIGGMDQSIYTLSKALEEIATASKMQSEEVNEIHLSIHQLKEKSNYLLSTLEDLDRT